MSSWVIDFTAFLKKVLENHICNRSNIKHQEYLTQGQDYDHCDAGKEYEWFQLNKVEKGQLQKSGRDDPKGVHTDN